MNPISSHRRVWIILFLAFCVTATRTSAQIPRTLSYQGILSDTLGTPKPDGTYAITFRLYDAASGGTLLWAETQSLQVRRGLFSAVLGSQTPFPSSLTFERQYWLGIQPAGDPELLPRIALSAVGYSLNALRADTARVALNAGTFADSARIAGTVPDNSITANKIAAGQVVKSINNIRDAVTLRAQGGATITSSGDTITINAGSGGGGTGVQSIQNTNNTIDIISPTGPTVTANLKVPLSLTAAATPPNAVLSATSTSGGDAIAGRNTNGTGVAGVSTNGVGVYASSTQNDGIQAFSGAANKSGVWGSNGAGGIGVAGSSSSGTGVYGTSTSWYGLHGTSINNDGIFGESGSNTNAGVFGNNFGGGYGVRGSTSSSTRAGVWGDNSGNGYGVLGTSSSGRGVYGSSNTYYGVYGSSNAYGGVYGSGGYVGVYGSNSSTGTFGYLGGTYYGVYAETNNGYAVYAVNTRSGGGLAGYFSPNVTVTGTKSFKIDHPLDPANKYLVHFCVESDEVLNTYSGNVVLDANGEAWVELPAYFEALNKDFRYQLTAIGAPGPNLYIAQKIWGNRFKIAGGTPGMEVSWQVTGIRNDPYLKAHPAQVEVEKTGKERGKYIHPKEYGVSETLGIEYEAYQKMKADQEKMQAEHERRKAELERMQAEHEKMNLERQKPPMLDHQTQNK